MAEIVGLNKSDAAYLRRLKRAAAKAPPAHRIRTG